MEDTAQTALEYLLILTGAVIILAMLFALMMGFLDESSGVGNDKLNEFMNQLE